MSDANRRGISGWRRFHGSGAEEVDEFGVAFDVGFGVFSVGEFLEEELGETGGSSLETDFGEFLRVVATEKIDEVVLVEAVLEDGFLFETPFEVTAGGPVGNISFGNCEAGLTDSHGYVFVGDAIPKHAVDHVALEFWERSDAAMPANFAGLREFRERPGVDHCRGFGGRNGCGDRNEGSERRRLGDDRKVVVGRLRDCLDGGGGRGCGYGIHVFAFLVFY